MYEDTENTPLLTVDKKSSKNISLFDKLPKNIRLSIFNNLDPDDFNRAITVSKKWNADIKSASQSFKNIQRYNDQRLSNLIRFFQMEHEIDQAIMKSDHSITITKAGILGVIFGMITGVGSMLAAYQDQSCPQKKCSLTSQPDAMFLLFWFSAGIGGISGMVFSCLTSYSLTGLEKYLLDKTYGQTIARLNKEKSQLKDASNEETINFN